MRLDNVLYSMLLVKVGSFWVFTWWIWTWTAGIGAKVDIVETSMSLPLFALWLNVLANYHDLTSIFCKFKRVWLEVYQHLFDSLLITLNNQIHILDTVGTNRKVAQCRTLRTRFERESNKIRLDTNVFALCLVLLYRDYLINAALDVESFNVLHKLSSF